MKNTLYRDYILLKITFKNENINYTLKCMMKKCMMKNKFNKELFTS